MIESLQRIEYIRPNGTVIVLLNFGEDIEADIPLPIDQQVSSSAAALARWAEPQGDGAARTAISWTRYLDHPSFKMVRGYCASHPAIIPLRETGTLRIHFREPETEDDADDEIWEFRRAAFQGCSPVPLVGETTSVTTYRFEVGERRPIKGPYGPLHPAGWNLVAAQDDTMIVGDPVWPVETYTPPALSPGTPPVFVPAGALGPGTPPVLVPPGELNPGGGSNGPILRLNAADLDLEHFPDSLLELDFYPDGIDSFGKMKWRTAFDGSFYMAIATDSDPEDWAITVEYPAGSESYAISVSAGPAEFPWLATFIPISEFVAGLGTPIVSLV